MAQGEEGVPVLKVENVTKHYRSTSSWWFGSTGSVKAVDGVSFEIARGETLSIVGESGCGKSTVGRLVSRFIEPTAGAIWLDNTRIDNLSRAAFRPVRKHIQLIFQDPYSSLNSRMRVREILAEPLLSLKVLPRGTAMDARLAELMDVVRLPRTALDRFPHEFSGGQRQRICIARALATKPDLIICDEAVSALDVSVKAQIVNLLQELQRSMGMSLLFISHDLAVVNHLTHRVAVMYLGKIVEIAPRREIFTRPQHPYTRALLSAIPIPDPSAKQTRIVLRGDVPSSVNPPSGCRFHTRCPMVVERCRVEEPLLSARGNGGLVACHLAG
jgi:peptide/nickel transport system ATP-binding protein